MPVISCIHEVHLLDLPVWIGIAWLTSAVGKDAVSSYGGLTEVV